MSLRFATAAGYSPKLRLDLVFNDFVANSIVKNEILILSNGEPWRPLIHVKDMARAMEWSINYSPKSNFLPINIGSNNWNFAVAGKFNYPCTTAAIDWTGVNKFVPVSNNGLFQWGQGFWNINLVDLHFLLLLLCEQYQCLWENMELLVNR